MDVLSSSVPNRLSTLFKDSSVIYGLELFALVASFAVWQDLLAGYQVTAYVDNDPSSNGLVKGAASFPLAHNFIRRFWQLALIRSISVWLERVPSPLNWADMPTRDVKIPVKMLRFRKFPQLNELINMFLAQWSDDPKMSLDFNKRS